MGSATQDFVAGCFGGAAQLVVGHPFDTIKVKLQSQPKPPPGEAPMYNGAFDATKKTLAEQGPRGLFKGMGAPLATVAFFNAVLFTSRGQMEQLLKHEDGSPLDVSDQFVAGLGAGVAASMVACPTELIKCRLQAQSGAAPPASAGSPGGESTPSAKGPAKPPKVHYKGPLDVASKVWATEGGLRGIYKGLVPTLAREVPGNALMFGAYEALKRKARDLQGLKEDEKLGLGSLVLAGGLAGVFYWGPVYPADIVKSKIQVDDFKHPQYSGSIDCAVKTVRAQGIGGLYKGFGPAVVRGFPANGACFAIYEVVATLLQKVAD